MHTRRDFVVSLIVLVAPAAACSVSDRAVKTPTSAPDSRVDLGNELGDGPLDVRRLPDGGACNRVTIIGQLPLPRQGGEGDVRWGNALWAGDQAGYVVLWRTPAFKGFGFVRVAPNATFAAAPTILWPDEISQDSHNAAINASRLAFIFAGGPTCRLGITTDLGQPLVDPVDVGGGPGAVAQRCSVVPFGSSGFMAVWSQATFDGNTLQSLYARPFDLDGNAVGPTITLLGDTQRDWLPFYVTYEANRVLVARPADNRVAVLSRIDLQHNVDTVPITLGSGAVPADDMFMHFTGRAIHLRWADFLASIDSDGNVLSGPISLGRMLFGEPQTATLGDNATILLDSDVNIIPGILEASLIDDGLLSISLSVTIATEPKSSVGRMIHSTPSARHAAILHTADGYKPYFTVLGCTE